MIEASLGDVALAGCFAVGELGPLGETSYVHGNSASLMVFREKSEAVGAALDLHA
jgi:small ligand-binding sensory domain FIST